MRIIARDSGWSRVCPCCFYLQPDCYCNARTTQANDDIPGSNHQKLFDMACEIEAQALGIPRGLL